MKKIIALALLLFVICTPMCAINAHGVEDPCGKGCPLIERSEIEKSDFEGRPDEAYFCIVYLYDCGNRAELYTKDGLEQHAIYDYSKDFIELYARQSDESFQYSLCPVPVRQVIVEPAMEE